MTASLRGRCSPRDGVPGPTGAQSPRSSAASPQRSRAEDRSSATPSQFATTRGARSRRLQHAEPPTSAANTASSAVKNCGRTRTAGDPSAARQQHDSLFRADMPLFFTARPGAGVTHPADLHRCEACAPCIATLTDARLSSHRAPEAMIVRSRGGQRRGPASHPPPSDSGGRCSTSRRRRAAVLVVAASFAAARGRARPRGAPAATGSVRVDRSK